MWHVIAFVQPIKQLLKRRIVEGKVDLNSWIVIVLLLLQVASVLIKVVL